MVRNYESKIKFDEVHEAVLLLRQSRTRNPKKILSTLSDLWRRKVLSLKLYARKLSGGNPNQIFNYARSFTWNILSERLSELPMSEKKSSE